MQAHGGPSQPPQRAASLEPFQNHPNGRCTLGDVTPIPSSRATAPSPTARCALGGGCKGGRVSMCRRCPPLPRGRAG
eukprot:9585766-Alexandrium_andersonii.AAC.1